jgi:hypothetical protein
MELLKGFRQSSQFQWMRMKLPIKRTHLLPLESSHQKLVGEEGGGIPLKNII